MTSTPRAERGALPTLSPASAAAVSAWNALWRDLERLDATTRRREDRIDLDRRLAVLRRQHAAALSAASSAGQGRAVVAHRSAAVGSRLALALVTTGSASGVEMVENAADAVGAALVLQPALVVVDAPLPMMTAVDAVAEIRRYVPAARIAVSAEGGPTAVLLAAGATTTYRRGATPAEVVDALLGAGPLPEPR
jgi:CheY-like chemotaxis protein